MKNNISTTDAVILTMLISALLFVTGLSTIPYASKFDGWMQNCIYFLGRLPIIFVSIIVYLNLGKKNE